MLGCLWVDSCMGRCHGIWLIWCALEVRPNYSSPPGGSVLQNDHVLLDMLVGSISRCAI